jgi:hypothetical protein
LYSVVSEKITKIQEEMVRKSAEIREEYETRIKEQEAARAAEELAKLKQEEERREIERTRLLAEKRLADNTTKITNYITLFNSNVGRNPENNELRDSLNETVEADILTGFLETYDQITYVSGANNV